MPHPIILAIWYLLKLFVMILRISFDRFSVNHFRFSSQKIVILFRSLIWNLYDKFIIFNFVVAMKRMQVWKIHIPVDQDQMAPLKNTSKYPAAMFDAFLARGQLCQPIKCDVLNIIIHILDKSVCICNLQH